MSILSLIIKCPMKQNATLRMTFLLFLGVAYLLLGAFVFSAAELKREEEEKLELLQTERQLKIYSNLSESDYKLLTNTILKLDAHRSGSQWTFAGAFYFAITVVTTIGYGHSVPRTQIGKLICIFYAIVGVPFWLVTFQCMGERLNAFAKRCWGTIARKTSMMSEKMSQKHLIIFGILSCFLVTLIGVGSFAYLEKWSYVESAYYVVMTLSTIGFGDYVALQDCGALDQSVFHVLFSFLYIILGLTVVGAFMNLTIVRLIMTTCCDARCESEDEKPSRSLSANYDTTYSNDLKDEKSSYEKIKDNLYLNSRAFQEEEQKYDECGCKESKKKSYKNHIHTLKKFSTKKLCCCCFTNQNTTKFSDFCETNRKEQSNYVASPAPSPYFARNRNFNNNNDNESSSDSQDTQHLDVSIFTSANSKDDAEEVLRYNVSPSLSSSPSEKTYNNSNDINTNSSKNTHILNKFELNLSKYSPKLHRNQMPIDNINEKQTNQSKADTTSYNTTYGLNGNHLSNGPVAHPKSIFRPQCLPLLSMKQVIKRDSCVPPLERETSQSHMLLPGQCSRSDVIFPNAKTCQFQEKKISSINKAFLPCSMGKKSTLCFDNKVAFNQKSNSPHYANRSAIETNIKVFI